MARRICTIAENNFLKNKYLSELKKSFRTYDYPEKVVEIGIQKALKISQTELRQPKTIENSNNSIAIRACLKCSFSSSGSFGFCQTFDYV